MKKSKWPPYVTARKNVVSYRPRIPVAQRHLIETGKSGFLSPPITLGKTTDPESEILENYEKAQKTIDGLLNPKQEQRGTIRWLSEEYFFSPEFLELMPDTQIDYRIKIEKLLSFGLKKDGGEITIGDMPLSDLDRPTIKFLMNHVLNDYKERGYKGTHIVNGQFRCLSSMFSYCLQTYTDVGLDYNPVMGVRKLKTERVTRYVTDPEYWAQYEFAKKHGADYLPVFFEHAYLLASRSIEVYNLTLEDVLDEGYLVERRKGSEPNVILWSDRLRAAYDAAMKLRKKRGCREEERHLILGQSGKINRESLKSAMSRLKKADVVQ
ncbi:MAG: hypothetical protein WBB19_02100 [Desulforhopalus sp.]